MFSAIFSPTHKCHNINNKINKINKGSATKHPVYYPRINVVHTKNCSCFYFKDMPYYMSLKPTQLCRSMKTPAK